MIKRRNRGGREDKDDFLSSSFAPLRIGQELANFYEPLYTP